MVGRTYLNTLAKYEKSESFMKKDISHTVKLGLNSAGFKGKNLDSLTPDFMTDRKTELFLFWEPSYNGPHSWIIDVVVVGAIYKLGESFLNELFADLYNWSKKKLFIFPPKFFIQLQKIIQITNKNKFKNFNKIFIFQQLKKCC